MTKEYVESRLQEIDNKLKDYEFMRQIFKHVNEKTELEEAEKLIAELSKEQLQLKKELRKL